MGAASKLLELPIQFGYDNVSMIMASKFSNGDKWGNNCFSVFRLSIRDALTQLWGPKTKRDLS